MASTTTAAPALRSRSTPTQPRVAVPTRDQIDSKADVVAGLVWVIWVGAAVGVCTLTIAQWQYTGLGAAPFDGRWDWRPGTAFAPALALGAGSVLAGPYLSRQIAWKALLPLAGLTTGAWAVVLAAADGWEWIAQPLTTRHEYLSVVGTINDPAEFTRTYVDQLSSYPVHVQGHPPGMTLVLWVLDRIGLAGAEWAAAVVLAGASLATVSTLVALRAIAGETAARRAAPFVAIAPAALWLGTSSDALFAGVGALGVALLVAGRRPSSYLAGGVVLGLALHLTYGAVPLLVIPLLVALWRRDLRPLLWAVPGVLAVTLVFVANGFWWLDGIEATRHMYKIGISQHRPYPWLTFIANPAVLALATGPAALAGMWMLRRQKSIALAILPLAGLASVLLADLSGFSKGEVERIWLPFIPWLLTATATLPIARQRVWLGAQVSVAVVLQAALRSPW